MFFVSGSVLGPVRHALFDPRSLHRPDRCNKQGLRPRQDGQGQCQCRQRPDRHADQKRPLKICFGKQGHRHHNVTHYADGQPRRPIVRMDLTEAFIAHGAPVDLVQIAFEELAAAARGTPSGYRANDRGPDAHGRDELLTDIGSASVAGDQAIGPIAGEFPTRTLRRHRDGHDVGLDDAFEFGQIILEHLYKLAGGDVECLLVAPCLPRLQVAAIDTLDGYRYLEAEMLVDVEFTIVERAVERGRIYLSFGLRPVCTPVSAQSAPPDVSLASPR